MNIPYY
jgi:hypothetical protein